MSLTSPRFIKFDGVHPIHYLRQLTDENRELIEPMSFSQYHNWLMSKRINYSDYYAYNLKHFGWETFEFVINDPVYIDKAASFLFGKKVTFLKLKEAAKNRLRPVDFRWERFVVKSFIHHFKPDVIFVREGNPFPSSYWGEFSKKCLLVNRIAMNFPKIWNPMFFDLIFTSLESYQKVFESNGIPSYLFYDGFDQRISQELDSVEKTIDISHAGGAGLEKFEKKTRLFEKISRQFPDFHWYGWGTEHLEKDSPLHNSFKGYISGIDMYRLYRKSRIIINDYGDVANGVAVNQRIYETLGVGSFLLTREASNLKEKFPEGIFATFSSDEDCIEKLRYYLENEAEREAIAAAGAGFAKSQLDYVDLMGKMDGILRDHLQKKFPKKGFSKPQN